MEDEKHIESLIEFKKKVEDLGLIPFEFVKVFYFQSPWLVSAYILNQKYLLFIEMEFLLVKCPICGNIPRTLPVECCQNGHFVCNECRGSIILCPLCRANMMTRNINTLAGAIAEISSHQCKFSSFGCDVIKSMKEIEYHESTCPERIVRCPYPTCHEELQLKNFSSHAVDNECALDLEEITDVLYQDDKIVLPYVLARDYLSQFDDVFENSVNGNWRMLLLHRDEQDFYISLTYIGSQQCFVMFLMLPLDVEQAAKYRVTLSIEEPNKNSPTKYTYVKQILSIDQLKNIKITDIPLTHCVILTHTVVEKFLSIRPNTQDIYNTVYLPIYVENILKKEE